MEYNAIIVDLKKRRDLPLILETMRNYKDLRYEFLQNRKLTFTGATSSLKIGYDYDHENL